MSEKALSDGRFEWWPLPRLVWGGRLKSLSSATITDPIGAITTYNYDEAGNVTSITEATGTNAERTKAFEYDAMNRLSSITDGTQATLLFAYDDGGNLIEMQLPTGEGIAREYDERDRLSAVDDPHTGRTEYEYDGDGNLTLVHNARGNDTEYTYDDAGQLTAVTDAVAGTESFSYDALGNVASLTDANGHTTTFVYDALGRRTRRTNPAGQFETFGYDLRGNTVSRTTPADSDPGFTLDYDARSRLIRVNAPDDTLVTTYDSSGNVLTAADADSMVSFGYDDAGRRISETATIGSGSVTVSSAYDLAGNRTELLDSFGGQVSMGYDGAGRLDSLSSSAGTVVIDHDPSGRLSGILFPSDSAALYDYDASGRLATITHIDPTSEVLASYSMGYNAVGSINAITEPDRARTFGYDNLERLVSESVASPPTATPDIGSYDYDLAGNRRNSPVSDSYDYGSAATTTKKTNRVIEDDQFEYAYDANGDLATRRDRATGQITTYHWDSRNELTGIDFPDGSQASYRYDALGRRVEKTAGGATRRYFYDMDNIALETDGSSILLRRYRHGDAVDQPLVLEDLTLGESFFYHADHLGSVKLLTDGAGIAVNDYDYDAYGRRAALSDALAQPYAFTGREYDDESGLYYYRARYYDPDQGRFMSEDPIGLQGGPNLYSYVEGNPVNLVDPTGKLGWDTVLTWIAKKIVKQAGKKVGKCIGAHDNSVPDEEDDDGDGIINLRDPDSELCRIDCGPYGPPEPNRSL